MPDHSREIPKLDRRVISVVDAFAGLAGVAHRCSARPRRRSWIITTGIEPLDRLLGGGLRCPGVTTLESARPAQAEAVAYSIARSVGLSVLVATDDPPVALAWLVAGLTGIPAAAVLEDELSVEEHDSVCRAVLELNDEQLELTSVTRVDDLELAARGHARVIVVFDPARFGEPSVVLDELVSVAARTEAAVLAVGSADDVLPMTEAAITRIVLAGDSHTDATLIRTDLTDLLTTADVRTDCFRGLAR